MLDTSGRHAARTAPRLSQQLDHRCLRARGRHFEDPAMRTTGAAVKCRPGLPAARAVRARPGRPAGRRDQGGETVDDFGVRQAVMVLNLARRRQDAFADRKAVHELVRLTEDINAPDPQTPIIFAAAERRA